MCYTFLMFGFQNDNLPIAFSNKFIENNLCCTVCWLHCGVPGWGPNVDSNVRLHCRTPQWGLQCETPVLAPMWVSTVGSNVGSNVEGQCEWTRLRAALYTLRAVPMWSSAVGFQCAARVWALQCGAPLGLQCQLQCEVSL